MLLVLFNFISVKLEADGSNYLIWRNQFESILITSDLYDYVDGEPVQFINIDGEKGLNHEYYTSRKNNGFVMSYINATLSDRIFRSIVGCKSAREILLYLEKLILRQFFARKSLLRSQLHYIRRGNRSISDYIYEIKSISDSLAAIDHPVDDSDLVM